MEAHATLTVVLALGAGVLAQSAARHLHVPGIVLLLAAGVGLGPDGLDWVRPRELGHGLFALVDLAVAIILFEGGLNLELSRLRREQTPIRRLITLGAGVTLVGGATAAALLLGWSWTLSLVFGGLVVVTGPTVVTPLVREVRLKSRVATVLEAEGVLIDPVGAIVAVLLLGIALSPETATLADESLALLGRFAFGGVAGAIAGLVLAGALRVRAIVPEGYENIFSLAMVLVLFGVCEQVASQSGIVAVMIAGAVVGNLGTPVNRDLREFKDQLTVLSIGLLFVLLAADVRFADMKALGWAGGAVVASLVLVVRPLNAAVSLAGSELTWRERAFVAWTAPRGIVAAAVASLAASALEQAGVAGGTELRALVFLTIAGTVVLAGLTVRPVASLLDVRLPRRERAAILGIQGLGLLLAKELERGGTPVVMLDANPQNCARGEEAGLRVIYGDALEERTMQRAGFELVATAIGLAPNDSLNARFVRRAHENFSVPFGLVARLRPNASDDLPGIDSHTLFDGAHDVNRWDVRCRHDDVEVRRLGWVEVEEDEEATPRSPGRGEQFIIFAIERGERVLPMHEQLAPKEGDTAIVAIHTPERDAAMAALSRIGWAVERA